MRPRSILSREEEGVTRWNWRAMRKCRVRSRRRSWKRPRPASSPCPPISQSHGASLISVWETRPVPSLTLAIRWESVLARFEDHVERATFPQDPQEHGITTADLGDGAGEIAHRS